MKRKIGRMLVVFLTAMILAVTVEAAETICPANPDDQKWNFEKAREWGDFARVNVNENSAELVIGLTKGKDDISARLSHLITVNGGKIVKTISTKKEVMAIVAEVAFDSIPNFVLKVKATGLAKYIEPNLRVQAESFPNDPYWTTYQWGPQKIEADWAWNVSFGDHSTLVAIIDSGIDYTHPDLEANYVEGGYDWVNNDDYPMDDYGHGTKVAGVIAAVTNNGIGIAGLAQVKVMAEKIYDENGRGYVYDVVRAINHATNQGAKIISMSLGTYTDSQALHDAIIDAYNAGVLLVAAAGNDNTDMKLYPAAYDEVIAVTATNSSDNPAGFSNHGDWVELAAPGVDIFTTALFDGNLTPPECQYYRWGSGTSLACPHVSGVAALIWSEFPNETRDWVRNRLRDTADDLGDTGFDNYYGYGRINARKAIYGTSPAVNYTLEITTTAGGTTYPAPGNYTSERQNVPVEALPDTGYGLDHWELDEVNVSSANPYSVHMDSNHTLHAVFVPAYTLTITATTGGTTNPSNGSYQYSKDTNVPVNATPGTYHTFDCWELDGVNNGSANPYSVLMDKNHTLHAVFVQINYTLTITATAGGTTDLELRIYTYPAGSDILVIAIPDTDYVLGYWELDGTNVGSTNPITVTIDADHALHAVFRPLVYDIAVTLVTPSKTIVGQGYSTNIKVTIANQGDFTETFVTLYVGDWNETRTVYLPNGTSKTLTFIWNTSGFAYGNYTIWAYAEPVPGETDIDDNTFVYGLVTVTIPGDMDGDLENGYYDVDLFDAVKLLACYGARQGDSNFDPNCDIDNNGQVFLFDAVILCNHYGQKYPIAP